MPTRKQRRRRAKEFRHEYIWEDAEGNELDPDEVPARKETSKAPQRRAARSPREPQPPSWRRTLKRALIFAPIMFIVVTLLSSELTLAQRVTQTLIIALVFIPFSFFLDGVFWRSYQKRIARLERSNGSRGS
jgi:hypothetical protein